ncbi:crossover junction endodeoxyribonuclease RuvC [Belliella aquatica]|uniref:Crossover junction endodeoxyribonuclease RuvC n=1 Tax=Belliella aquatica TaxID=1323734 RepID=A0ABQ1N5Q9_9BACT|nr:crossover junction endodeoxyribonuclease RuvC [Belliella aquatica]MCH7407510.1 crossover junction endodeoxyribonuclease RuvC [Belliella aquatica]GGC54193.1 crossover junction endodeoxyribonuclease RuvC [Belliella aquatica]
MSKEEKKEGKEKIILGIDPGTNVMGYGLILIVGKKYSLIQFGVIHLKKYASHELKLKKIFERVTGIIEEFHPDTVALEAPFYGENVQSMLKLGRSQGVAMAAALAREIPITEYSPKKVKQSVTGNGNASKEQVAEMIKTLLQIKEIPKLLDATDALAVALCHHFHDGRIQTRGRNAGWKSFLEENPDRVKGLK